MEVGPVRTVVENEGRNSPSCAKVRSWLLEYISREQLVPGDRIPSERILAKSLGLSRPTVARALAELVSEDVLMRQERSGTFVGERARGGRSSGVRNIGIMMPWLTQDDLGKFAAPVDRGPVPVATSRVSMHLDVMHGAISVLTEHDCRFEVVPNNSVRAAAQTLARFLDDPLDGVLAMAMDADANEKLFTSVVEAGMPVVFIDRYCRNVRADRVVTDNAGGARNAVRYLMAKGHRRIAMFTDFGNLTSAQDRLAGYRAGLEEAGIGYDDNIVCGPEIVRYGWWKLDFALQHCLGSAEPITAVFCMNDTSVLATLDAADRLGISIPGDLEIIGFFDDQTASDVMTRFTRIKQSTHEMGRIAAEMLVDRMSGAAPSEPREVLLPAEILATGE